MFGSDWETLVYQSQINKTNVQTTYIDNIEQDNNYSGLIPRMIQEIFLEINKEEYKAKNFVIYCSFLQIYNEKIYDLLQVKKSQRRSKV